MVGPATRLLVFLLSLTLVLVQLTPRSAQASPPCTAGYLWGAAAVDSSSVVSFVVPTTTGLDWFRQQAGADPTLVASLPVNLPSGSQPAARLYAHADSPVAYLWTSSSLQELSPSGARVVSSTVEPSIVGAAHFEAGRWTIAVLGGAVYGTSSLSVFTRDTTDTAPVLRSSTTLPNGLWGSSSVNPAFAVVRDGNGAVVRVAGGLVSFDGTTFSTYDASAYLRYETIPSVLLPSTSSGGPRLIVFDPYHATGPTAVRLARTGVTWTAFQLTWPSEAMEANSLHAVGPTSFAAVVYDDGARVLDFAESSTDITLTGQRPVALGGSLLAVGTRVVATASAEPDEVVEVHEPDGTRTRLESVGPIAVFQGRAGACSCACSAPGAHPGRSAASVVFLTALAVLVERRSARRRVPALPQGDLL